MKCCLQEDLSELDCSRCERHTYHQRCIEDALRKQVPVIAMSSIPLIPRTLLNSFIISSRRFRLQDNAVIPALEAMESMSLNLLARERLVSTVDRPPAKFGQYC